MAGLIPLSLNAFDNFFGDRWTQGQNYESDVFKIDVKDMEKDYIIEADLPGVGKEEISLNAENKTLSISLKREEKKSEEKGSFIHRERRMSSMSRGIRLADADLSDVKAKLDNGVLTVTVPKKDKTENIRPIEIQ